MRTEITREVMILHDLIEEATAAMAAMVLGAEGDATICVVGGVLAAQAAAMTTEEKSVTVRIGVLLTAQAPGMTVTTEDPHLLRLQGIGPETGR